MLKVHLKLKAKKEINGHKEGSVIEITNDVFCNQNGIAYWSLNLGWEVIEMRILEYKEKK